MYHLYDHIFDFFNEYVFLSSSNSNPEIAIETGIISFYFKEEKKFFLFLPPFQRKPDILN